MTDLPLSLVFMHAPLLPEIHVEQTTLYVGGMSRTAIGGGYVVYGDEVKGVSAWESDYWKFVVFQFFITIYNSSSDKQ